MKSSKLIFFLLATVILAGCRKEDTEEAIVQTMSQKAILTKFYEALNGDNWMEKGNWCVSDNIGDWYGVVTDDKGLVTGLYLSGNHLEGYLPDELFELVSLENLILDSPKHHNTLTDESKNDWNLISGDLKEIAPKIARLTNLKNLDFNGLVNITCGEIPDEIWMPQIERIVLSQILINGCISPAIGNATNLKELSIARNNAKTDLKGTIPTEITKLKKLETLDLAGNRHLSGTLPENIGNMESLQVIWLRDCALTGTIPESIFNLKKLYSFDISRNFLEGEFDLSRLVEYPNLDNFTIHTNNRLQGIGEIPDCIRNIYFDRDGMRYLYEYGVIRWSYESTYNTP